MEGFEEYVLEKLDAINDKVHTIDKRLAFYSGGITIITVAISVAINQLL